MKKLLPVAAIALLATACTYDNDGRMRWAHWDNNRDGYCDHCVKHPMEPLSDRSLGSSRGRHNAPIEYNEGDVYGYHNTDYDHGDSVNRTGRTDYNHHNHTMKKSK